MRPHGTCQYSVFYWEEPNMSLVKKKSAYTLEMEKWSRDRCRSWEQPKRESTNMKVFTYSNLILLPWRGLLDIWQHVHSLRYALSIIIRRRSCWDLLLYHNRGGTAKLGDCCSQARCGLWATTKTWHIANTPANEYLCYCLHRPVDKISFQLARKLKYFMVWPQGSLSSYMP